MAKVSQVFQTNVFQNNAFQQSFGLSAFQRSVFQTNVFDVGTILIKVINETLSLGESQNQIRALIRIITETENISVARDRLRALVKVLSENLQYSDGELYYTGPSYIDKNIINIIANCDIFKCKI